MDNTVILTIAQAILANTKVLQTLVESLPKEVQAEVANQVTTTGNVQVVAAPAPVAQPAPTPVAPVTVTPVVAVAAPVAPAAAFPSSAPVFANQAEFTAFIMDNYKALGPIKGAKIQEVLLSAGTKNINEAKPEMYAAIKSGVEALRA